MLHSTAMPSGQCFCNCRASAASSCSGSVSTRCSASTSAPRRRTRRERSAPDRGIRFRLDAFGYLVAQRFLQLRQRQRRGEPDPRLGTLRIVEIQRDQVLRHWPAWRPGVFPRRDHWPAGSAARLRAARRCATRSGQAQASSRPACASSVTLAPAARAIAARQFTHARDSGLVHATCFTAQDFQAAFAGPDPMRRAAGRARSAMRPAVPPGIHPQFRARAPACAQGADAGPCRAMVRPICVTCPAHRWPQAASADRGPAPRSLRAAGRASAIRLRRDTPHRKLQHHRREVGAE